MSETPDNIHDLERFFHRRYPCRMRLFRGVVGPAPLADLALIIGFFVMAQSWLIVRPGVTIEAPPAVFSDGADASAAVLTITQAGRLFFEDGLVSWETLDERLREAVEAVPGRPLLIEADEGVAHGDIMRIHALAESLGFSRVVLATSTFPNGASTP
jgi:biopolymer transport protein ExbD